jgi:hypothetical protein
MDSGLRPLIWLLCISDLIEAQTLKSLLPTKSPLAPLFQRGVIPPLVKGKLREILSHFETLKRVQGDKSGLLMGRSKTKFCKTLINPPD